MDFKSFNKNAIVNKTLWALGFHISTIRYLKKKFLHFIDINNLKLTAKLPIVNNFGQIVTNSKKTVVKKKNKYTSKKKYVLQTFVILLDLFCLFILNFSFLYCLILYQLLCLLLCSLLCLILYWLLYLFYNHFYFLFWISCYFIVLFYACSYFLS